MRKLSKTFAVVGALAACLTLAITVNAQSKKPAPPAKAPAEKSEAAAKAEETYKAVCQACHLADGKGLTPDMSFTDGVWKHGSTVKDHAKIIADGVPNTVMLAFKDKLSEPEIMELAKMVHAFEPKKKK
jgi:mono/diheme cytochrome c family protein